MECKNCSNTLPADAKFCNKCGKPIGAAIVPKENIEKWKKDILNTGNSVYAIGWLTIAINVGIYIWSILDKNFSETGLPAGDLAGVFVMVVASSVFVILGKRVKDLVDKNIKTYLQVLLALCLLLFVWVIATGGRVGLLFIFVIIYLLSSLGSIKKLMKTEEFTSTLTSPKYILDKKGWIIFAVVGVVLFFVAAVVDSVVSEMPTNNNNVNIVENKNTLTQADTTISKEEYIKQVVVEAKKQMTLPNQLDSVTTMVDMVARPNAIRYQYVLHDLDATDLSNESFRNLIKPDLCKSSSMTDIMDQGIGIEYSYSVKNTQQTFFVSFTKNDCLTN